MGNYVNECYALLASKNREIERLRAKIEELENELTQRIHNNAIDSARIEELERQLRAFQDFAPDAC